MDSNHNGPVPFIFGIPLRAKAVSNDWDLVCLNLQRTLRNLLSQTDQRFCILLACHEVPAFLAAEPELAAKLHVIDVSDSFDPPESVEFYWRDYLLKKRAMGVRARQLCGPGAYFMVIDADDLLHKDTVAIILQDDNRQGYIIEKGYMLHCLTSRLAPLDPTTTPFYRHCGSCGIFYFAHDEFPTRPDCDVSRFNTFEHHVHFIAMAAEQGRPLTPLNEYMGLYLVAHGENWRRYLGLEHKKDKFIARRGTDDPAVRSYVRDNFPFAPL